MERDAPFRHADLTVLQGKALPKIGMKRRGSSILWTLTDPGGLNSGRMPAALDRIRLGEADATPGGVGGCVTQMGWNYIRIRIRM